MNKNESVFFLTEKDLPGRENKRKLMFEKYKFFNWVTSARHKMSGTDCGDETLEMGKGQDTGTSYDTVRKRALLDGFFSKVRFILESFFWLVDGFQKGQAQKMRDQLGSYYVIQVQVRDNESLKEEGW